MRVAVCLLVFGCAATRPQPEVATPSRPTASDTTTTLVLAPPLRDRDGRCDHARALVARALTMPLGDDPVTVARNVEEVLALLAEARGRYDEVSALQDERFTRVLFERAAMYELASERLRRFDLNLGVTTATQHLTFDALARAIIPLEEDALEQYEGAWERTQREGLNDEWTIKLRHGLTRLNDVQYPPL